MALFAILALAATARADENDRDACLYQGHDGDHALCIRKERFNTDLCAVIDHFATTRDIPPAFFARLIWRESLFRPDAVSPKGAEGIAQFMPGTARLRGLQNSFDVIQALDASSSYLSDLRNRFGNLGLAAAAYNAGEDGLRRFLTGNRLPIETRDYVFMITGAFVETWRDNPPESAAPELARDTPFQQACVTLAETAHYNPAVVDRLFNLALMKLPPPLSAERALFVRQRGGNFGARPRYAARIGRENRAEATKLCTAIRAAGVPCTVFRNR